MLRNIKLRLNNILLTALSGGMLLQLGTCNPNVRDSVLSGLETTSLTFANVLISTLFDGLGEGGTGGSSLLSSFF